MEKNKKENRKTMLLLLFVLSLILIATGITYTVFIYSNSSINDNNTIKSGQVTMTYSEQSNSYVVDNALPKDDNEAIIEDNYFEFKVTSNVKTNITDTIGVQIPYEINMSKKSIDSDKKALTDENIKVYLTKVENGKEISVVSPIKVSDLGNSLYRTNATKIAYKLNAHKNGNETITTTYRLRAWIDYDTDISNWDNNDVYQYKFTVNINSDTKYVGYTTDPSCFTFDDTTITGFSSSCDATNLVIPSSYSASKVGKVLTSYTADENNFIKYVKESTPDEGQTYEDYLKENNLTDEQFVTDAKNEYNNFIQELELETLLNKDITGTLLERIYTEMNDETSEDGKIYKKFLSLTVEEKSIKEAVKKITAINTTDFQNRGIKTIVLPKNINLTRDDTFIENAIDLLIDEDGALPKSCYNIEKQSNDLGEEWVEFNNFKCTGMTSIDTSNLDYTVFAANITNSALKTIIFSDNADSLAGSLSNNNLTSVDFSNTKVTYMANAVFKDNNISSLKLSSNIKSIGESSFANNNLTSLDLTKYKNLYSIDSKAFMNNKIKALKFPKTLQTISNAAFSNNKLEKLDLSNIELENLDGFEYNEISELKLPSTLYNIGGFKNNDLTSLDLTNTRITSIEQSAFQNNKIKEVKFPDTLKFILKDSFSSNKLTSVDLSNTKITYISDGTFSDNQISELKLPETITNISGFIGNKLENLDLSNTKITMISEFAANKMKQLKLPNTLKKINDRTFYNNDLTSVDLSNTNLETIGAFAFENNKLTTVKLPATVTSINRRTFYKTTTSNPSLTSIIYPGTTKLTWLKAITNYIYENTDPVPCKYNDVSITAS